MVVLHGGNWRARYGKLVTKPISVDLARQRQSALEEIARKRAEERARKADDAPPDLRG